VPAPARSPDRASSGAGDGAGGGRPGDRQDAGLGLGRDYGLGIREQGSGMDAARRKELIDQYNDGYRVVAEALVGAKDDELDAHPAPGKWSAREVVHHLADSEMTAATRLRLMVGTDNPQIVGYD